jgi:transposase InsO family protein
LHRVNSACRPLRLPDSGPQVEPQRAAPQCTEARVPRTQGKIERWHQTLKNRVLLENYFLPGDLERQIEAFIEHYNHRLFLTSLRRPCGIRC